MKRPDQTFIRRLAAVLLLFSMALAAQDSDVIHRVKEHIYWLRFAEADSLIEANIEHAQTGLDLTFYRAYNLFLQFAQKPSDSDLARATLAANEATIELAKRQLKRNQANYRASYYMAMALGLRGIYHLYINEYVSAYWYGADGIRLLEKLAEEQPHLVDARLGLGIFRYFVSLMPGVTRVLAGVMGFSGSREAGLADMESVAQGGEYFDVEARFALVLVYYFAEGNSNRSEYWLSNLRRAYPDHPLIDLLTIVGARRAGHNEEAIKTARRLINDDRWRSHPSLLYGAYYNLGRSFHNLNLNDSALLIFREMRDQEQPKSPFYRSVNYFWLGLQYAMTAAADSAQYYFREVRDVANAGRWYREAQTYLQDPITEIEIEAIRSEKALVLGDSSRLLAFIARAYPEQEFVHSREHAWVLYIGGIHADVHGEETAAFASFLDAEKMFRDAGANRRAARAALAALRIAINANDQAGAEKALAAAEDNGDRFFRLQLRPWQRQVEKIGD
jgi:tetratricopeptide (TPR) repeat protein